MRKKAYLFFISIVISGASLSAQTAVLSEEDKTALEGIVVEKYYKSTKEDAKDTTGGILAEGSVTYRIYVDLKPGYHLQAVYGVPKHEFYLKTSTKFFNNKFGGQSGDQIIDSRINQNSVALDSWLTIGVATKTRFGILKKEDKDSSIIKRNMLNKEDGLILAGPTQKLLYYGLNLNFFGNDNNASNFHSDNGSWVTIGGGKGQTKENRILIAQLTTDGKLSFELNVQIGTPSGGTVQFVANNPEGNEIKSKHLIYK